jgi:hypothetical protein
LKHASSPRENRLQTKEIWRSRTRSAGSSTFSNYLLGAGAHRTPPGFPSSLWSSNTHEFKEFEDDLYRTSTKRRTRCVVECLGRGLRENEEPESQSANGLANGDPKMLKL